MRVRLLGLVALSLLASCSAPAEDLGSVSEELKVCPGATTVKGIDVSHYDGTIDWTKVKSSGRDFAIMKVTEGTAYEDPTYTTNWAGSKAHGVIRGAYHFFHSNMDPIAQADWFVSKMGPLEPGDLPPTLDLEVTDGESAAKITSTAIAWLDHVAAKTGLKPILYTSPAFVTGSMGSPAGLENHATLWIANWGVTCPDVPTPFKSWDFWQYDDKGTVPGITGAVDLDEFDGTMKQLVALTKPSASPDAGVDAVTDTGTTSDAASDDTATEDSADDAASSEDSSSSTDAALESAPNQPAAEAAASTGCSCTTAQRHTEGADLWWAAFAAAAWVVARRHRRATRRRTARSGRPFNSSTSASS
ncbi:MAG: glycoside hydrolase family 25 protein [Polyangiales bacterium]